MPNCDDRHARCWVLLGFLQRVVSVPQAQERFFGFLVYSLRLVHSVWIVRQSPQVALQGLQYIDRQSLNDRNNTEILEGGIISSKNAEDRIDDWPSYRREESGQRSGNRPIAVRRPFHQLVEDGRDRRVTGLFNGADRVEVMLVARNEALHVDQGKITSLNSNGNSSRIRRHASTTAFQPLTPRSPQGCQNGRRAADPETALPRRWRYGRQSASSPLRRESRRQQRLAAASGRESP